MIRPINEGTRKGKSGKTFAQTGEIIYFCRPERFHKQYGGLSLVNITWLREESPGNTEHHIS